MYRKVEEVLRMTSNEACVKYPDEYILMRMDGRGLTTVMGTVMYIGDDYDELFGVQVDLDDYTNCFVIEGLNHRRSLGGIIRGT